MWTVFLVGKSGSLPTPRMMNGLNGDLEFGLDRDRLTRKWQQFAGYQQHDAQESQDATWVIQLCFGVTTHETS